MSIETPHTTGLFAELLEGAKAVSERPTLVAERDAAKQEALGHQDRAERMAKALDDAKAENAILAAEIARLEEANDKATFQAKEAGSKLSLVADVLKDVMGNATAAMELVEPPKPEPVVTQDVQQDVASPNASTTTEAGTVGDEALPGEYPWTRHPESTLSAAELTDLRRPMGTPSTLEAAGSTPAVPFVSTTEPYASSETGRSQPVHSAGSETSQTAATTQATASSPKPYSGHAYWTRPDNVTVDDFIAGGGEVAPWDRRSA